MDSVGDRMIRAAGGVLWRSSASGAVEVALVHRPEYDDWSLPKGKLRRGEEQYAAGPRRGLARIHELADAGGTVVLFRRQARGCGLLPCSHQPATLI
jgi:8-oxo-dGTP diphosphatase